MRKRPATPITAERRYNEGFAPAAQAYSGALKELLAMQRRTIDQMAHATRTVTDERAKLVLLLNGLMIALGAFGAVAITRSIIRPLSRAVKVAETVAGGDLTGAIDDGPRATRSAS